MYEGVLSGRSARWAFFGLVALLYTAGGMFPGRLLLPMDQLNDLGAWKADSDSRIAVSNSLLSDVVLQFVPWDEQIRRELAAGRVPWRNKFAADGSPLFANPQTGMLSPFTWPRLLWGMHGWSFSVLLKLLVAAFGCFYLTRRLGGGPRASLLSGLVYMTSGYSILWALHPHTSVSACLPWIANAAVGLTQRRTIGGCLSLVAWTALATAGGHPETLALGLGGICTFLCLYSVGIKRSTPDRLRRGALVLSCAVCGILILGIQLVPFAYLLGRSATVRSRSTAPLTGFRGYALLGQILPGALGMPLKAEIDFTGALVGSENLNSRSQSFVGCIVLLVIVLVIGRLSPPFKLCVYVAIVGAIVSLRAPPSGILLAHIPLLRVVAYEYSGVVTVLFFSVAAGPAVACLAEKRGHHRRVAIAFMIAGLTLLGTGLLLWLPVAQPQLLSLGRRSIAVLRTRGYLQRSQSVYEARMNHYMNGAQITALRRLALPGLCWVAAGGALVATRRRRALLAAAISLELLGFGVGYLPAIPESDLPGRPAAIRDLKHRSGSEGALFVALGDVYPPNLGTLDEVHDLRSFDVLESEVSVRKLQRCGYDAKARLFPSTLTPPQAACLATLGVRYVVARNPGAGTPVGGEVSPAVGLYELAGPVSPNKATSGPPDLLASGCCVSLFGVISTALLIVSVRRAAPIAANRGFEMPQVE